MSPSPQRAVVRRLERALSAVAALRHPAARRTARAYMSARLRLDRRLDDSGLDALLASLDRPAEAPGALGPHLEIIARCEELFSRLPASPNTCLYRALARYAALRERGFDVSFHLGVRPAEASDFVAHAWVELDGAPLLETTPIDYARTFSYPTP